MKPVKEKETEKFRNWGTNHAQIAQFCGLKKYSEWFKEPWSLNNIRECNKWINVRLQPLIDELVFTMNLNPPESWQFLKSVKHSDWKQLTKKVNEIKVEWTKRPRHKHDWKGRHRL